MRVAADDERGVHIVEDREQPIFWRESREDLGVVARRRMTAEHGAEARDVESKRRRPRGHDRALFRRQLLRRPAHARAKRLGHRGRAAVEQRERLAVAVAVQKSHGHLERQQPLQRVARHRPRQHIAADNHLIDALPPHLGQHRFERRQIPMNVAQHRDAGLFHNGVGSVDQNCHPRSTNVAKIAYLLIVGISFSAIRAFTSFRTNAAGSGFAG